MADQDSQSPIVLQLDPGSPGSNELTLRIAPEYEAELAEMLREAGIYGGDVIELSNTALSVLMVAVGPAGAITSLSIVLNTFLKNHRARKVDFGSNGELKTIQGYSTKDVDKVIDSAVRLHAEWTRKSLEQGAQWNNEPPENGLG